jgi:hypothetical protein
LAASSTPTFVMAGLVPAIHAFVQVGMFVSFAQRFAQEAVQVIQSKLTIYRVDGRDKPGHDGVSAAPFFGE